MDLTGKLAPSTLDELFKSLECANLSYTNHLPTPEGFQHSQFFEDERKKQNVQAYAFIGEEKAFVAFRGTEEIVDWVADMDIIWEPTRFDPLTFVHKGFQDQYLSIHDKLMAYLKLHKNLYTEVIFCGHSLGGGLAAVAAPYFYYFQKADEDFNPKKIIKVHTFAAPRVGGKQFNSHYQVMMNDPSVGVPDNYWRVLIDRDPVPMMPPPREDSWFFGSCFGINDGGYMHTDGSALEILQKTGVYISEDNKAAMRKNIRHVDAHTHHTKVYLERMEQIRKQLKEKEEAATAATAVATATPTTAVGNTSNGQK